MPGQENTKTHRRDSQPAGRTKPALPTWESFPLEDRRRLVRTILQAARRQVEARPLSTSPRR